MLINVSLYLIGGIDKLTGDKDGEGAEKTESGEDPEV